MSTLAILGGKPTTESTFPMEMPQIGESEIYNVVKVLRERRLSIFSSPRISEFEQAFANYVGTSYAIAVNSGTAALHASLVAARVGEGDEVIVPVYTYAATANAVLLQHAIPVFVDIDRRSFNLDVDQVEAKITSNTKVILAVDLFGNPVQRARLKNIASRHGLHLVEDCAQSTGAQIDGAKVGSFGIGCHSFGEIKNITSAEGGMITTDDPEIARIARLVRHAGEAWSATHTSTIGSSPSLLVDMIRGINYELVGHNYRMNALQAALGMAQLQRIDTINGKRQKLAAYYDSALSDVSETSLPSVEDGAVPVYNRYVVLLDPTILISRDAFLAALICEGVPAGVYYPTPLNRALVPSNRQMPIENGPHSVGNGPATSFDKTAFPNAEYVCEHQLLLPCYPGLDRSDVEKVVAAIRKVILEVRNPHTAEAVEKQVNNVQVEYFGQFFSAVRK